MHSRSSAETTLRHYLGIFIFGILHSVGGSVIHRYIHIQGSTLLEDQVYLGIFIFRILYCCRIRDSQGNSVSRSYTAGGLGLPSYIHILDPTLCQRIRDTQIFIFKILHSTGGSGMVFIFKILHCWSKRNTQVYSYSRSCTLLEDQGYLGIFIFKILLSA